MNRCFVSTEGFSWKIDDHCWTAVFYSLCELKISMTTVDRLVLYFLHRP